MSMLVEYVHEGTCTYVLHSGQSLQTPSACTTLLYYLSCACILPDGIALRVGCCVILPSDPRILYNQFVIIIHVFFPLRCVGGFDDNILPSTSSESTTTIVASSSHTAQSMDIDDSSDLSSVDLPQDLCDFIAQTDLPLQQPNSTQNSSIQPQYTHHTSQQSHLQQQQQQLHSSSGLTFESRDGYNSGSNVGVLECDFGISHHHSDPSQHALYDSTEHFPGPFDVFCAHPDRSVGSYQDDTSGQRQPQRKSSNTSICSEPLPFDSLRVPPTMFGGSDSMASNRHHLSLPNLANLDTNEQGQSSSSLLEPTQGGSPIPCGSGGFTSSPCSHRSISPGVALPDIPEGVQIRSPMTQFDPAQFNMDLLQYRTSSPVPSSPSIASVSSRSTVSTHEFFDSESPSVLELCEMLSESPNVRHQDFSHMVLTGTCVSQLSCHSREVVVLI